MRIATLAVLALALASTALAGASDPAASVKVCLTAAGKHVDSASNAPLTYSYPEIVQQISWQVTKDNATEILFTASNDNAIHLVARLVRVAQSFGATKEEALRSVGRRGNVVWSYDSIRGLRPAQRGLLEGCLAASGHPQRLDKAGYGRELIAVGTSLSDDLDDATLNYPPPVDLSTFQRLRSDLIGSVPELAQVIPPPAIQAQHAQLRAAMQDLASEVEAVHQQLAEGHRSALRTVKSLSGIRKVRSALKALAAVGYPTGR